MSTLLKEQPKAQQDMSDRQMAVHSYMNDKIVGSFTQKELDTLKSTIAAGTTKEEFSLFVQTCVNSGLNPFLNHIHPVVFEGRNGRQLSIQISVEGIMALARKREGFAGVDVQLVAENDNFKMARVNGYMQIVTHEISFPRGQIVGGYAIARRKEFPDVVVVMEANEVEHMKRGRNGHMWTNYFSDMFKKHMLKRAAKEQYGIELTEEEVVPPQTNEHFKAPDNVVLTPNPPLQQQEAPRMREEDQLQQLWAAIHEKAAAKSMSPYDIDMLLNKHLNAKAREDLSASECAALLKFIELTPTKQVIEQHEAPPQQDEYDDMKQFASVFE